MKRLMARSDLLQRWDIVVLPFPYVDRYAERRRPALVVSGEQLHRDYGLAWVAMITSAENMSWTCDVEIDDLSEAGLSVPSVVRPAKLATVETGRIVSKVGRLAPTLGNSVQAFLSRGLSL